MTPMHKRTEGMGKRSPPGATIQDMLDERNMTQADLARSLGRPFKTINELIKGKARITEETAMQLEFVEKVTTTHKRLAEIRERVSKAQTEIPKLIQPEESFTRDVMNLDHLSQALSVALAALEIICKIKKSQLERYEREDIPESGRCGSSGWIAYKAGVQIERIMGGG